MNSFVLQDWTTIRCNSTLTSFTQGAAGWLDVGAYQDVVLSLDVRSVTDGGPNAPIVPLTFQTSPLQEDYLFVPMVAAIDLATIVGQVRVTPIVLSQVAIGSGEVPIGRWLRWKIDFGAQSVSQAWEVTLRVIGCGNPSAALRG